MFYKISRPSTYFNKDSRDMYVNTEDAANMVKNLLALIGIEVKVEKVCDDTSCRGYSLRGSSNTVNSTDYIEAVSTLKALQILVKNGIDTAKKNAGLE